MFLKYSRNILKTFSFTNLLKLVIQKTSSVFLFFILILILFNLILCLKDYFVRSRIQIKNKSQREIAK